MINTIKFITSRKIDDTTTKNDDKENLIQIDFDNSFIKFLL